MTMRRVKRAAPKDDRLVLRPIGTADAAWLSLLHADVFADEAWNAEAFAGLMAPAGARGLIAERVSPEGVEPVGFVLHRFVADEAEILALAVAPAARRQGVARALLEGAIADARSGGSTVMFLEVAEDNRAACALYRAAGFREVGRRPGYYRRGEAYVTALVLRASLQ
jgi:ribosomal-protein-alanine N-acetyltransferase